ncbi:MAG: sigma-70 family RNA polymerase sigma factor [Clostridia bacterium]|nr:sigma-70 family RNA polymerase sigma factor [Clostridia bacterium]
MLSYFLSAIEDPEDKRLFERIYLQYRGDMFRYAMTILKDEGNAEDVVHEVFLFIVRTGVGRIRCVGDEGNLWAYLSAAVRNRCYTFLKKNRALQEETSSDERIDGLTDAERTEQRMDYQCLVEAIRGLKEGYADVLYFSLVQQMPADRIAQLLGLKPAAVRKRISRGKEMLRRKLGKDLFS